MYNFTTNIQTLFYNSNLYLVYFTGRYVVAQKKQTRWCLLFLCHIAFSIIPC